MAVKALTVKAPQELTTEQDAKVAQIEAKYLFSGNVRALAKITLTEDDTTDILATVAHLNALGAYHGTRARIATAKSCALLVHHNGMTPDAFGQAVGVTKSTVSQMRTLGRVLDEIGVPSGVTVDQLSRMSAKTTKGMSDVLKFEQGDIPTAEFHKLRKDALAGAVREWEASLVAKPKAKPEPKEVEGTDPTKADSEDTEHVRADGERGANRIDPKVSTNDTIVQVLTRLGDLTLQAGTITDAQLAKLAKGFEALQDAVEAERKRGE